MRFGFCAPIFAGSGGVHPRTPLLDRVDIGHLRGAILEAEALGYDTLWVADHLALGRDSSILEGWTFLSWASRVTSTMRLGTIHLANLFRAPSVTAKSAATLDAISGGRLDFFFEAGHRGSRPEADAYGFEFPDDDERLGRFDEALQIVKAMWTQDRPTFNGRYYSLEEAVCYPRPVQRPHPPVWVGTLGGEGISDALGMNEAVIDLIARQADWWNNTPASLGYCRKIMAALDGACARNNRDPATLGRSLETQVLVAESPGQVARLKEAIARRNPGSGDSADWDRADEAYLIGDVESVTRRIRDYADLGIECFMLWFMDYPSLDGLRTFARRVAPYFNGA